MSKNKAPTGHGRKPPPPPPHSSSGKGVCDMSVPLLGAYVLLGLFMWARDRVRGVA